MQSNGFETSYALEIKKTLVLNSSESLRLTGYVDQEGMVHVDDSAMQSVDDILSIGIVSTAYEREPARQSVSHDLLQIDKGSLPVTCTTDCEWHVYLRNIVVFLFPYPAQHLSAKPARLNWASALHQYRQTIN